eukprot:scaffold529_cov196-Alexandrium_tamarense.AAC.15
MWAFPLLSIPHQATVGKLREAHGRRTPLPVPSFQATPLNDFTISKGITNNDRQCQSAPLVMA